MFALVDCNNFYASCETLFRLDLRYQPVVVISNNDGFVVALKERKRQRKLMSLLLVNEVWGVGERLTKRLNVLGMELADTSQKSIHREFNLILARTVRELNGEPCSPLELASPRRGKRSAPSPSASALPIKPRCNTPSPLMHGEPLKSSTPSTW